jgi:hypothetical protein
MGLDIEGTARGMPMSHETAPRQHVTIHEVYVEKPPGWFRKIGNGPWESVSLAPYNGILPLVWMKSSAEARLMQRETWAEASAVPESTVGESDGVIAALASALQSELGDCSSLAQELRTIVAALRASYNAGALAGAHHQPTNFTTIVRGLSAALNTSQDSIKAALLKIANDGDISMEWMFGAHPSLGEAAQPEIDADEFKRLLQRLLRGIRERDPKSNHACALWTQGADSDGCGSCLSCMEMDAQELLKALEAADAPQPEGKA